MTKYTRISKPLTISLPPQLVQKTDALQRQTGKTRSEVFREALSRYFDDLELQRLFRYGERQAMKFGIKPNDVERLVSEVRTGKK